MIDLRQGDCTEVLRTLPAGSVHTCVTSPPYFGLRDYGADGQIGLERTPDEYVARMVEVFREVRRVLRDDGTLWLNLGDSFASASSPRDEARNISVTEKVRMRVEGKPVERGPKRSDPGNVRRLSTGLADKQLLGIPWRVAFALQADGWYLRSDIIWHKPNPMPESVRDRPTKAHEYLFLLSKSATYHYDADAVREEAKTPPHVRSGKDWEALRSGPMERQRADGSSCSQYAPDGRIWGDEGKRNRRSVWTVATRPYKGAHFATFPPMLIEPCILAGTSEAGCCRACGKPWERVVARQGESVAERRARATRQYETMPRADKGSLQHCGREMTPKGGKPSYTLGFRPTCPCDAGDPVPCTVLDPFNGAGTSGVVAQQHGRSYIGIDLNPEYLALTRDRIPGARPVAVPAA